MAQTRQPYGGINSDATHYAASWTAAASAFDSVNSAKRVSSLIDLADFSLQLFFTLIK